MNLNVYADKIESAALTVRFAVYLIDTLGR